MPAQLFDPTFLKKLEMLTLAARQLFRGQTQGERRATSHGASVEFADFRPYVQGDDFRRIDWNAFARFETLMLRLFVEEQELSIHILLDCSASMDYPPPPRPGAAALVTAADPTPTSPPGAVAATKVSTNKFDYARRLAAALAYIGLANTDQVSLTPFGGPLTDKELAGGGIGGGLGATIGPRRGKPAIIRLMEALEDLKAGGQAEGDPAAGGGVGTPRRHDATGGGGGGGGTDLNAALARFALRTTRSGLVIVISDLLAEGSGGGFKEGLQRLRYGKHEVVLLQTLAPEELRPELLGDVRLVDAETQAGVEVSANRAVLQAYGKRLAAFLSATQLTARQAQAQHILVNTGLPLDELVLRQFRQMGLAQ